MNAPRSHTCPNVPLLKRVLDHIEAHPETHDQDWWAEDTACGTVMCIAGHTVAMTGHTIDLHGDDDQDGDYAEPGARLIDGRRIEDVAREELGLTRQQAYDLFHLAEDLGAVWATAARITDGATGRRPAPAPGIPTPTK